MGGESGSVLVVEDETAPGAAVTGQLRGAGLHVDWVRSVREARQALRERPPDIMLLDLSLETDGLELLQALRFSADEPRAGIVVLADVADASGRERSLQLGAAAVLSKPVAEGAVVPVVRELLSYL